MRILLTTETVKNKRVIDADHLEEGADAEESGDRWFSLDLAKALRFYQRAYTHYQDAALGTAAPDARYNAARLLLAVHTQYIAGDIDVTRLDNVGEVLTGDERSVCQDIGNVVAAHEAALNACGSDSPIDLMFNTATAYSQWLEEAESPADFMRGAHRAVELVRAVWQIQISDHAPPEVLLETAEAGLAVARAVLENTPATELDAARLLVAELVKEVDSTPTPEGEGIDSIEYANIRALLLVARTCVEALASDSVAATCSVLEPLSTPEGHMLAADCIEAVILRFGIDNPETDAQSYWDALSAMDTHLKLAQQMLLAQRNNNKSDVGAGGRSAQLAMVYIARADIDLQRSQLPLDSARTHAAILEKNVKAFLTNASAVARATGGLRETVLERTQRQRRWCEAQVRLAILEQRDWRGIGPGCEAVFADCAAQWYFRKWLE